MNGRIMLLPLTVNQAWKAILADLVNTLDDMLFVFDGRRRVGESELDETIRRWKDAAVFSVFDAQTKQHIGLAGWYAHNGREAAVYAWAGLGMTDNRADEKEIKTAIYEQLTASIFGNVQWVNWVIVKTRLESKDAPILKSIGYDTTAEYKNYLFVDGKYVSARICAIGRK